MKDSIIIITPTKLSSELDREISLITMESLLDGDCITNEAELADSFAVDSEHYASAKDAMRKGVKVKKINALDERAFYRYMFDIITAMQRSNEVEVVESNL